MVLLGIVLEEPYLEGIYGEAYRRYLRRSDRYLGIPEMPEA